MTVKPLNFSCIEQMIEVFIQGKINQVPCKIKVKVGMQGRKFYLITKDKNYHLTMNQIICSLQKNFIKSEKTDLKNIIKLFKRIKQLDNQAYNKLDKKNWLVKVIIFIRQYFGNRYLIKPGFDKRQVYKTMQNRLSKLQQHSLAL